MVRYHDPCTEDRLQICRAANCVTGPGEYAYMYVYMRACSNVCVPEHACVYSDDEWTDGQRMERWVDLICVCARPCLHACDPVCEVGMIDARLDG